MGDSALQRLLRRDAVLVSAALASITVLAWIYVIRLAADMDMGGMDRPMARGGRQCGAKLQPGPA
jgi:predicted metal-binding membrane protein